MKIFFLDKITYWIPLKFIWKHNNTFENIPAEITNSGDTDRITKVNFQPLINPIVTPAKNVAKYLWKNFFFNFYGLNHNHFINTNPRPLPNLSLIPSFILFMSLFE